MSITIVEIIEELILQWRIFSELILPLSLKSTPWIVTP